jgi:uncharacterized membrane protein YdjX (TVP38/TMEM64 family)
MEQRVMDLLHGASHQGVLGLLIVAAAFFIISLTFLPRPPACVAAGLLYGAGAFPVVLLASTLGSMAGFVMARGLLRERFRRLLEQRPAWRRVVEAIDSQGWSLVLLLRFASPVPGSATTYLTALTSIGFWPYTVATLVGLAPQTLLFVLMGAAPAALGGSVSGVKLALILIGVLTSAAILWQVGRRARASLSRLDLTNPPAPAGAAAATATMPASPPPSGKP